MATWRSQANKWIYPKIGPSKLKDFTAADAEKFFEAIAKGLGKRSLTMIKSTLRRSIRRAQVQNLIGRNMVLRMLTWDHVDLNRGVVRVRRSASKTSDTKTAKSRRSLILPKRAIAALKTHEARQDRERREAGEAWHANNFVFCRENGQPYTSGALNP